MVTHTYRWSRATRELRWNEIARAALILGLVEDYEKGSMRKIADILKARVESGKVQKRKRGTAQSSAAFYRAVLEPPPNQGAWTVGVPEWAR